MFEAQCGRCHGLDGSGGLGPDLRRSQLSRAPDDAALRSVILEGIPGTAMGPAGALVAPEAVQVAAYVRTLGQVPPEPLMGDAARGRIVYEKAGCASCHIVAGVGGSQGPELSRVGAARGAAHLRQAILDPGAALPEVPLGYEPGRTRAFVPTRVETKAGLRVEGVRASEDTFTLQIRDAQGRLHSFRKDELRSLEETKAASSMPSFRASLGDKDVEDLVAYLAGLRGQP